MHSFLLAHALSVASPSPHALLRPITLTARSYQWRGWITVPGALESFSRSWPKVKAALLAGGMIVAIILYAMMKAFTPLSDAEAAAASGTSRRNVSHYE